jgi:hypothetical protein
MNWKPTKYNGYEVSNTGLVKSVGNHKHNKILKPTLNNKGYEVVYPSSPDNYGYKISCQVHRLVGEAFIPNPENKPQINHKDGNKRNNNDWNLEWVTNLENHEHKIEHGLIPDTHKPKRIGQYDKEGNLIATFDSIYAGAQSVDTTQYVISRAVNGLRKTAKGYIWKYI